ncbi:hypothetical protein CONPUDRAFT_154690 [Coniophora puteana RWD-64-598 SS2]|uniref:Uncharacterized protein n=1 Tax=Coniophora puteana (strain RWD-64-598) TaxID=741705 RepID=A0A5M3MNS2_CONPW|nr:uncharacterized protein CONPUDRAFT_154690 [Coniophora puteana RWD-64-598 SS2]EIW80676.1 hypothetical protein CONPUDRAFT_154690 [Coniophora puteana RWD-64-598 SS2]
MFNPNILSPAFTLSLERYNVPAEDYPDIEVDPTKGLGPDWWSVFRDRAIAAQSTRPPSATADAPSPAGGDAPERGDADPTVADARIPLAAPVADTSRPTGGAQTKPLPSDEHDSQPRPMDRSPSSNARRRRNISGEKPAAEQASHLIAIELLLTPSDADMTDALPESRRPPKRPRKEKNKLSDKPDIQGVGDGNVEPAAPSKDSTKGKQKKTSAQHPTTRDSSWVPVNQLFDPSTVVTSSSRKQDHAQSVGSDGTSRFQSLRVSHALKPSADILSKNVSMPNNVGDILVEYIRKHDQRNKYEDGELTTWMTQTKRQLDDVTEHIKSVDKTLIADDARLKSLELSYEKAATDIGAMADEFKRLNTHLASIIDVLRNQGLLGPFQWGQMQMGFPPGLPWSGDGHQGGPGHGQGGMGPPSAGMPPYQLEPHQGPQPSAPHPHGFDGPH